MKEVAAQTSFYSVNDRRLHFGLGACDTVTVTITWTETIKNVASNQLIEVKEGSGIVKRDQW